METNNRYPHDPNKYSELFQHSRDSYKAGDTDSLENLRHQANSLHTEGYLTKREKKDITKLITILLEILSQSTTS